MITLLLSGRDWDQVMLGLGRVSTVAVASAFAPLLREHISDLGLRTLTDTTLAAAGPDFTGRDTIMIEHRARLGDEARRMVAAGKDHPSVSAVAAQALAGLLHGVVHCNLVRAETVLGSAVTLRTLLTATGCVPAVAGQLADIAAAGGDLYRVGRAAAWLRQRPARAWLVRELSGNPAHTDTAARYVPLLADADAKQPFDAAEIDVAVGLMRHLDSEHLVDTVRCFHE